MKRSFRAATVFAGTAACAVTIAPAAGAATVPGVTPAGAHAFTCSPLTQIALHLYYTASEKHPTPACVSGNGYVKIGNGKEKFQSYKGSAYSGYLYIGGQPKKFSFGDVAHNLYGATVSAVSLKYVA
jgi:hypothetical protein